ncbi:SRPBCC family protein [Nonomuraea sp. NPDC049028]|uniref:SRPBCC family protein n=1 Tax=Nonomuraea sp. NPDC049028 TaxID=3364348 RepID=UPI003720EFF6
MIEVREHGEISRPAAAVWAVVADYGQDPRWRKGVETMAPRPGGIVRVGTTTAEVMRFAGRTYRNGGEVTGVEPGRSFDWRTTSGIDAEGGRSVVSLGKDRCRFAFHVRVAPRAASERLLEPVLGWLLRRAIRADIRRLADLLHHDARASRL